MGLVTFTNAEKAAEAKREVGLRKWMYPKQVLHGSMSQAQADRRIDIMEEIQADYEALAAKERFL